MNCRPTSSYPPDETARLAALRRYRVVGTPPEAVFDHFARLAAGTLGAPTAVIGFVERERCWFKARVGIEETSAPREQALCARTLFDRAPLVVLDADINPRFRTALLVRGEKVRFYVGAPLISPAGFHLGALGVIDTATRAAPTREQLVLLAELAEAVVAALEVRVQSLERASDLADAVLECGRFAEVIEAAPVYTLSATPNGALLYANRAAREVFGLSPGDPLPKSLADVYPVGARGPLMQEVLPKAQAQGVYQHETAILASGVGGAGTGEELREVPVSQVVLAHRSADGQVTHVSVVARDLTPQKQQERLELGRAEVLELIARGAPLPAVLLHLAHFLETTCPRLLAAVSLLRDSKLYVEVAPNLPSSYVRLLEGLPVGPLSGACAVASSSGVRVITSDVRHDPSWHNLRFVTLQHGLQAVWSDPILSDQGEILGTFALYSLEVRHPTALELRLLREAAQLAAVAISRQQLYAQLQRQAYHDPLTGLPNRLLMQDRLKQVLLRAERRGETVGVLLLDLDDFKQVNDSLGHSAGDLLLQQVAGRLQACLRSGDTVARIGGDEFVLIFPLASADAAAPVAQKVLATFSAPFVIRGRSFEISASIGVSLYPFDGQDLETLVKAADSAMYVAKAGARQGRKVGYRLYQQAMTDELEAQLQLEAGLRQALVQDEFRVHFQPRLELRSGLTVSFEALVRWQRPDHGLLLPGCFLSVAEKAGLLPSIDEWVLTQAVAQLGRWRQQGISYLLSCNLSASSFQREGLIARLGLTLRHYEVDPSQLELEITENLLMRDLGGAAEQLRDLKTELPGVRIAIDDFGSGYSSLAYLRHLPIDTLKIDRAFVKDLDHSDTQLQRTALAVIRTIILLGRDLNFRIVAEGAETDTQLGMLTALGVDEVQGYIISRPAPLHEFLICEPQKSQAIKPYPKK